MTTWLDDPLHIDARGRTAQTTLEEHVYDLILQVLFTTPGERVNRPEFGSGIDQLVFMPNSDAVVTATQQMVAGALHRWLEDVITVQSVDVRAVESRLDVKVVYTRRDTGERREQMFSKDLPA